MPVHHEEKPEPARSDKAEASAHGEAAAQGAAKGKQSGTNWQALAQNQVVALEPMFGDSPQAWGGWLGEQEPQLRSAIIELMHERKGNGFVAAMLPHMYSAKLPPTRPLNGDEISYVAPIYLNSIDYSEVRLTFGSLLTKGGYARTTGNTIHMPEDARDREGKLIPDRKDDGLQLFGHEMGHVWQYQNAGLLYAPDALIAQAKEAIGGRQAYDWRAYAKEKQPFERWNPEAQAEMGSDYNIALRRLLDKTLKREREFIIADIATLQLAAPYIGNLGIGNAKRKNSPSKTAVKLGVGPLLGPVLGPIGGVVVEKLLD